MMERDEELPQEIIHRILSFLPTEEAVHTSVLSKAWLQAWSTNPNLNFDYWRFSQKICIKYLDLGWDDPETIRKSFLSFVDNTLARHSQHGLGIDKLVLNLYDPEMASLLDKWLEIVDEKAVKQLRISVYSPATIKRFYSLAPFHTMPQTIFAADSLTVFEVAFDFKLCDQGRVLINPKRFYLEGTMLQESTISHIGSEFPSIEELTLKGCHGLQKIEISNLPKLTEFSLVSCTSVRTVDISKAESLKSFTFKNLHRHKLDLALPPSTCLKCLKLRGLILSDMVFHNLISQCLFLKCLTLKNCYDLERIHVSSRTLECLKFISDDWTLKDVEIDAPKLIVLKYRGVAVPSFSSKKSSGDLESCVDITPHRRIDTDFFIKLRKLQGQVSPSEISLTINSDCNEVSFDIKELPKACLLADPKPKLINLRLSILSSSIPYSSLLDGLLWSFCLQNLTINLSMRNRQVYFFCKELMNPKHQNCCGSNEEIRCWRHCLNWVECVFFKEGTGNWLIIPCRFDWKSWLDGTVVLKDDLKVRFSLNWSNV